LQLELAHFVSVRAARVAENIEQTSSQQEGEEEEMFHDWILSTSRVSTTEAMGTKFKLANT